MVLRSIIIFILSASTVLGAVHNPGYYGEKDFDHFYGSRDLYYQTDPYQGSIQFEENKILKEYIDNLISPTLKDYQSFFYTNLQSSLSCPQWEMDKMYDYLRFSNRVIALSYIYEAIRLQNLTSKKLGQDKNCKVNWEKIISQCQPKSKDMRLFVKSAKHIAKYERESIVDVSHSIKKYKAHWTNAFRNKKYDDVSHYRVKLYCENEYCNKNVTSKTALKIIDKSCQKDTMEFIKICSELDNLYGMSEINEAYPLLANSDILTLFNQEGHASGCLRRFKRQNRTKEVQNPLLKKIFPIVYQQMYQDKERFPQGSIFFAGTLRQFADKGLDNIYRTEKKIVKKKEAPKKIVFKKKKEDTVEFINRVVKKKKKKVKKKKVVKKKKKSPKKSSFLVAVEMQQQLDMERVKVDMLRFKYDFLFSIPLKKILDKNLDVYTTRKGLEQMKKFDNLGSSQGPMPLMFLKYLIETEKHQALYNIMNVVGNKFYVNNDIDKLAQTSFDFIELQNDEASNNTWQINVVKEPVPEEEEAPPLIQQ